MEMFKLYMELLSLFVIALASDLKQTVAKSAAKKAVETYIIKNKPTIKSRYKLDYHVAAPVGWINYANGLSYYKGEYHLFYQFYPYDSRQGPIHCGHNVSPNLVDWKHLPTALVPEKVQCFSDFGVVIGNISVLTNTDRELRSEEPLSHEEIQNLAFNKDSVVFYKYYRNRVRSDASDRSPDFQDPKVWKHGDYWYVVLGSKTEDSENKKGRALLYISSNMINWEFLSVLAESTGDLGYMWKYPDFFELNEKYVLLISPLGMTQQGDRYKNAQQTGYIIGSFSNETFVFLPDIHYQELDFGHDFYAAQTTVKDGKRYLTAWFGEREEDVDSWSGALTIFRKLELVGYRIVMKPVDAMISLREETVWDGDVAENVSIQFDKTGELLVSGNFNQKVELEIKGNYGGGQVSLRWDPRVRKVVVDREGDVRQVEWLPLGSEEWRIFLDASSLEVFCGEGEVVFSTRVYPGGSWQVTNLSPQVLDVVAYTLRRSVPE